MCFFLLSLHVWSLYFFSPSYSHVIRFFVWTYFLVSSLHSSPLLNFQVMVDCCFSFVLARSILISFRPFRSRCYLGPVCCLFAALACKLLNCSSFFSVKHVHVYHQYVMRHVCYMKFVYWFWNLLHTETAQRSIIGIAVAIVVVIHCDSCNSLALSLFSYFHKTAHTPSCVYVFHFIELPLNCWILFMALINAQMRTRPMTTQPYHKCSQFHCMLIVRSTRFD